MTRLSSPQALEEYRRELLSRRDPKTPSISICAGTGCLATGAAEVIAAFKAEIEKQGLTAGVDTKGTGCPGFCERGPIVVIYPEEICYLQVTPADVPEIVAQTVVKKKVVDRLVYTDPVTKEKAIRECDIPFYKHQQRNLLRNNMRIDSKSIDDYLAVGGYSALATALFRMKPEEVLEEVKKSGLRGRGGAGFPTGRKWEGTRNAADKTKYVIVNADEGDPGAFMDRALLEGNPHLVLEGLIIGAYAIGAHEGYVYVRQEYPLAVENITLAIEQAKERGLLGKNILGSSFDLEVRVHQGAGAFVSGESTALMTALEGRPGEPRPKYVRSNIKGLWNKPTVLNNVETWANVPLIINKGGDWFARIGTPTSTGTKIFSLVGKISNTGLVEVPMGITLKEIIYTIGGGIPGNKKFKAVQTGGPSGGCIPADMLDLKVGFDELTRAGSMMGSGGMIVMDEDTCMVDIARYFVNFLTDESCGKCVPCREGLRQMDKILTNITRGEGKEGDLETLERLSETAAEAALCALGKSAPNPFLSTLRYFRDEYEAHIKEKRCPAAVCKHIISSPCQHICPLRQDTTCYIGLIAQGKFDEAVRIVRRENPLPSVCGRVCNAPCEEKCRAKEGGGEAVSIRALKRFLADYERQNQIDGADKPKQKRPERVAIVGSGPAGLTCAYYLAVEGYHVTIFESLPVPGGMLAVGIPDYRLPKDILNYEIEKIRKLGVEFRLNTTVGKDISFSELRKQFGAVFIATGAHKGLPMNIEGEKTPGVIDAVDFLRAVNLKQPINIGQRVAVIGGGNAAVDAARVAKRLGKDVKILYRRTRSEMPAIKEEVDEVINEGIEIQFLTAPIKVVSENGKLKGVRCIKMQLGDVDSSGRRKPVPIEGSEFLVEIDTLIPAIGQRPDDTFLVGCDELKLSKWGTLKVDPETLQTDLKGVFAGGDVVTGPDAVTPAMAHGKIAAQMMHLYLQGYEVKREYRLTRPAIDVPAVELSDEEIKSLRKQMMPVVPVDQRSGNFKEVQLGLTAEMAMAEAKRCLRCDREAAH